ncbi:MAG: flagellar hook-basal body complex protein FliE [Paracoccaceae bacterium]|jgi:flagellar hook-basal body complex protein FliE|nr:flagellar hook-basal body complex protein FliE [Paracoccaceae bacterium]
MVEISSMSVATQGVRGAYRSAQDLSHAVQPVADGSDNTSFAAMVRNAAQDAVTTIREGDKAAQLGLTGEMGTQQVVEATLALESTVKTVVAMRDKFVEAYQEVLRMPI